MTGFWLLTLSTVKINAVRIPAPNADFYVYDEVGVLSSSTKNTIIAIANDIHDKIKA